MQEKDISFVYIGSLFTVISLWTVLCMSPVQSVCTNVGPNNDENLQKVCDWSSWYGWNCTQCDMNNANTNKQRFRKRAICCGDKVNLTSCLTRCNFTRDSDTEYANCTKECDSDPGHLEIKPTDFTMDFTQNQMFSETKNRSDSSFEVTAPVSRSNVHSTSIRQFSTSSTTISTDLLANTSISRSLEESSNKGKVDVGVVIGSVFGSLVGILLLAGIILILYKKKRRNSFVEPEHSPD